MPQPPTQPDEYDAPPSPRQGLVLLAVLAVPVVVALVLYATWRPFESSLGEYALGGFVIGAALAGIANSAIPRIRRRRGRARDGDRDADHD